MNYFPAPYGGLGRNLSTKKGGTMFIPNLAPDEIQCIGCDCIKPADEIDWELFNEIQLIVCIDCVDVVDEILTRLGA